MSPISNPRHGSDEYLPVRRAESLPMGERGLALNNLEEMRAFAEILIQSKFAPQGYTTSDVIISVQYGREVGLSAMQSLQNVSVINGKPAVWGDAALGLVQASGLLENFYEGFQETPQGLTAICKAKRRGMETPITRTFSMKDAERAGLLGKGPWKSYTKRMLQMRARGFTLRDGFADVLKGLITVEEAQDYPSEEERARENRGSFGRAREVEVHDVIGQLEQGTREFMESPEPPPEPKQAPPKKTAERKGKMDPGRGPEKPAVQQELFTPGDSPEEEFTDGEPMDQLDEREQLTQHLIALCEKLDRNIEHDALKDASIEDLKAEIRDLERAGMKKRG